jgi:hypothetical protein
VGCKELIVTYLQHSPFFAALQSNENFSRKLRAKSWAFPSRQEIAIIRWLEKKWASSPFFVSGIQAWFKGVSDGTSG